MGPEGKRWLHSEGSKLVQRLRKNQALGAYQKSNEALFFASELQFQRKNFGCTVVSLAHIFGVEKVNFSRAMELSHFDIFLQEILVLCAQEETIPVFPTTASEFIGSMEEACGAIVIMDGNKFGIGHAVSVVPSWNTARFFPDPSQREYLIVDAAEHGFPIHAYEGDLARLYARAYINEDMLRSVIVFLRKEIGAHL